MKTIDIKDKLTLLDIQLALKNLVPPGTAAYDFGSYTFNLDFIGSHTVDLFSVDVHDILSIFPSINCDVGSGLVDPVVDKLLNILSLFGEVCLEVYFEECREAVGAALIVGDARLFEVQFNIRDYLSCSAFSQTIGDLTVTFDYENREITACYPFMSGMFDNNVCFVIGDLAWTTKAIGFTPLIRFSSTFDQLNGGEPPEFLITRIEIGKLDNCYPHADCDSCLLQDGCSWCNVKQSCVPDDEDISKCGGCPEDTLAECPDFREGRERAANQTVACGDFADYDLDGNYRISWNEFLKGPALFMQPQDRMAAFQALDANSDTFISYSEYCVTNLVTPAPATATPQAEITTTTTALITTTGVDSSAPIVTGASFQSSDNAKLSVGAIIGIVIAIVVVLAVVAYITTAMVAKTKSPYLYEKMAFWAKSN